MRSSGLGGGVCGGRRAGREGGEERRGEVEGGRWIDNTIAVGEGGWRREGADCKTTTWATTAWRRARAANSNQQPATSRAARRGGTGTWPSPASPFRSCAGLAAIHRNLAKLHPGGASHPCSFRLFGLFRPCCPSICPSRPPALHVHARTPARPYAYTPVRAPTPARPPGWPCEPSPHLHRHGSIRACVERQMAYLVMVQCPMCPVCASGAVWRPYIAHPKV